MRQVNDAGINLIKSFEGVMDGDPTTVNLDAYLDPIGIWTIGWGHAIVYKGEFLRGKANRGVARSLYPGGITVAQATELLRHDITEHTRQLDTVLKVPVTDSQYAALASFVFNLGLGNLQKSSLLRFVNCERFERAAREFAKWNRAGGKVMAGLTRRRAAEAALFREGINAKSASVDYLFSNPRYLLL
jgi:lysozyme